MRIIVLISFILLPLTLNAATYQVRGECEKEVLSDRASMTVGVTSTDKVAAKAQDRSTKTYEALLAKIKAAKLAHEEIQTESIQLYEDFDWIKGKKNSRGFISNMTLRVSTSDFSKLSSLIPSFTELGATQVGELSLFVSKAVAKKAYQDCLMVSISELFSTFVDQRLRPFTKSRSVSIGGTSMRGRVEKPGGLRQTPLFTVPSGFQAA